MCWFYAYLINEIVICTIQMQSLFFTILKVANFPVTYLLEIRWYFSYENIILNRVQLKAFNNYELSRLLKQTILISKVDISYSNSIAIVIIILLFIVGLN